MWKDEHWNIHASDIPAYFEKYESSFGGITGWCTQTEAAKMKAFDDEDKKQ